jgi:replicative DNA helicase
MSERDGRFVTNSFVKVSGQLLEDLLALKLKPIEAIPTPFPAWNHRCRDFGGGIGLARGWHVTIGANTGNGKSVFSLNMAAEATELGHSVGFISLEMSWEQLTTRYMSIVSGEKIGSLETGSRLDINAHRRASKVINERQDRTGGELHSNTRHIADLEDVEDAIRFLFETHGCKMVIVDYVQLAKVLRVSSLLEGVTEISGVIRGTGADLRLVTVALSQLNRETSKDYENAPIAQGLMGGSPLENDSDQVMLINHSHKSYKLNAMTHSAQQEFILGKNRHGPTGNIQCEWDYDTLRVREIAPVFTGPIV